MLQWWIYENIEIHISSKSIRVSKLATPLFFVLLTNFALFGAIARAETELISVSKLDFERGRRRRSTLGIRRGNPGWHTSGQSQRPRLTVVCGVGGHRDDNSAIFEMKMGVLGKLISPIMRTQLGAELGALLAGNASCLIERTKAA